MFTIQWWYPWILFIGGILVIALGILNDVGYLAFMPPNGKILIAAALACLGLFCGFLGDSLLYKKR